METVINLNEVVRASKKENNEFYAWIFNSPEYSIKLWMSNGEVNVLNYRIIDYDLFCSTWREIINGIENKLTINS